MILSGVLTSWKEVNSGRLEPAYFFLTAGLGRVVVKELSSPEDELIAKQGPFEIISFQNVWKQPCFNCKKELPVIEECYQFFDDDNIGYECQKRYLVVCDKCAIVRTINIKI